MRCRREDRTARSGISLHPEVGDSAPGRPRSRRGVRGSRSCSCGRNQEPRARARGWSRPQWVRAAGTDARGGPGRRAPRDGGAERAPACVRAEGGRGGC